MEKTINAPADVVWRWLGPEFANIDTWSSFVKTSIPLTAHDAPATVAPAAPVAGRETTTKATLREFITAYSDAERRLTFDAAGLPPIVRRGRNVQSVRDNGDGTSTLVFEIDFDFRGPFKVLGPIMRRRMATSLGGVQDDLRSHAEAQVARSGGEVGRG
ncbi:MAG: SRPBCC family protein [Actinomycetota bacterium]